jgi:3-deoxy-D-manno-octulosonic-acid transferase
VNLLYSAVYALLLIATSPFWLVQMLRSGKYRAGLAERLGRVPGRLKAPPEQSVWAHAVSVGEVLAISGVIGVLRSNYPSLPVFVSTTTLAGQKLARERFGAENVFYFPLDLGFAIRPYLQRLRPKLVIVAETEFWPNFLRLARNSGARIAIVNSRISDRSYPGYLRFRPLLRHVLQNVDIFLAQSQADASRLVAIGALADRVEVSGNLKFEVATPKQTDFVGLLKSVLPAQQPVLVCGSTVEGEEEALLSVFREVLQRHPTALMVIAPRHPERFGAVAGVIAGSGIKYRRRSSWDGHGELQGSILLLDTIGELAALYSVAAIAFVGGSLAPRGGHNILEPAQFGKAIIVGPHFENFREIIHIFRAASAVEIAEAGDLAATFLRLLENEAARIQLGQNAMRVMQENRGSTERTLRALKPFLEAPIAEWAMR